MKPINCTRADFPSLIEDGQVYVDKTAQIFELAKNAGDGIYFLSRPRRFGKSLLLSTLKALFQGRRELFKGLAIDGLDWDWEKEVYPVIQLDMSKAAASTFENFEKSLQSLMRQQCALFNVPFDAALDATANFDNLLFELGQRSANGRLVLLIDEYDAPMTSVLGMTAPREIEKVRMLLHDFYVKAKANCGSIRFLMVTGVSRFVGTSIFSAFNNPMDLSMDRRAADLLGYTHEEMETYFHEHILAFADARSESYDEAFSELLQWYDGYQFCPSRLVEVINPVSIGKALKTWEVLNYWEYTGGASLIFHALKTAGKAPLDFNGIAVRRSEIDCADVSSASVAALLYQGGYLTLEKQSNDSRLLLKIPNFEVTTSLQSGYISEILGKDYDLDVFVFQAEDSGKSLATDGYTETFHRMLQEAFGRLPHDWTCRDEREAKRYFLAFMLFARADVSGEPQHAAGRPDAVLEIEKGVYIFEFKYAESALAAIHQCHGRNYAARYANDRRPLYYVGVNYNPDRYVRTIDDVICEQVSVVN